MLICGDTHGNYPKVKAFLDYKPEKQHGFVGDYFDSFVATVEQQIETFKLIVESGSIMLTGNHDLQYFKSADNRVMCSGFTGNMNVVDHIEKHKDTFKAAAYIDDCVITHGGVHPRLFNDKQKDMTPEQIVNKINEEFEIYKTHGIDGVNKYFNCNTNLFNIGACRGGWNGFGGVFWLDYRYEKLDKRFNQVIGHTKHKNSIKKIVNGKKFFVPIDTIKFQCYNTKTGEMEDFMSEELEQHRDMIEICY